MKQLYQTARAESCGHRFKRHSRALWSVDFFEDPGVEAWIPDNVFSFTVRRCEDLECDQMIPNVPCVPMCFAQSGRTMQCHSSVFVQLVALQRQRKCRRMEHAVIFNTLHMFWDCMTSVKERAAYRDIQHVPEKLSMFFLVVFAHAQFWFAVRPSAWLTGSGKWSLAGWQKRWIQSIWFYRQAAACRFVDLLSLHMNGVLSLEQAWW